MFLCVCMCVCLCVFTHPSLPCSNNVLRMSEGIQYPGTVVWQLCLPLFLAWLIVFLVLVKGVDSVGKVSSDCAAEAVSVLRHKLVSRRFETHSSVKSLLSLTSHYAK